ncbi:glycosyltransferase family 2 protein [Konateibacter massiliensis]|uniref:glycosyltransferase family 2 protein n=1 Tax=Konateibacter massiliensis TaxID=2002841 RepID=UPI0015D4F07A|nr:glycosyltransferase family 2 protein [Konateibacter massiliensis]
MEYMENMENTEGLVSIIVPVYNAENFVARTIDSVVKQSYAKIELILVNDGSKDASGQICDECAKGHSNIMVIHQVNSGPGSAKNKGLELAKGEYIIFLDCDDMLEKNAVLNLVNKMHKTNADMVMPDRYYCIDENDIVFAQKFHFSKELCIEDPELFALKVMMGAGRGWRSHSLLFKKESLDKNNIRFISRSTVDDYFFNIECMKHFEKLAYIQECTVYYRMRKNSITSSFHKSFMNMIWKFDTAAEEFIRYKNIDAITANKYKNAVVIRTVINYITDIFSSKASMSWKERINMAKIIVDNKNVQDKFRGDFSEIYFTKGVVILYFKLMHKLIKYKMHNLIYITAKIGGSRR